MKIRAYALAGVVAIAAVSGVGSGPVRAQGTTGPIAKQGMTSCPFGYSAGSPTGNNSSKRDPAFCYPNNSNPPAVALRASSTHACPAGLRPQAAASRWCTSEAENTSTIESRYSVGSKIAKPTKTTRCPTGWASTENYAQCWTDLSNPTQPRLSKGKPCAPGELNDWGVWCTANYQHLTFSEAERHGVSDANVIYMIDQTPENGTIFSPQAKPYFAAKEAGGSAPASAGSADVAGSAAAATCQTGQANAAAIGGAIAGNAGAAIGGMLGGFGKKKKNTGC